MQVLEKCKSYFKEAPITSVIFLVITVLFIFSKPYSHCIIEVFAVGKTSVSKGYFWSLFTYSLFHVSFEHYLLNAMMLLNISPYLEKILGKFKYVMFFLITSIGSGLSIYIFSSYTHVRGLSGFLYGIIGYYLYLVLFVKDDTVNNHFKNQIIAITILLWSSNLFIEDVSISGHLGGFLSGIIFSIIYNKARAKIRFKTLKN